MCSRQQLALLFRRDAARLGPEVRVELPMAGAWGIDLPQMKADRP